MTYGFDDCINKKPPSENAAFISFYYEKGNRREESREVLRIDKNMLVNSIGGAAGLFLGYSLNSCLAATLDWIFWAMKKFRQNYQISD